METDRGVMIRYKNDQGRAKVGSGLRIGGNRVLTAAHVAAGTGHTVVLDSSESDAAVLVHSSDPEIDLAVLEISIPDGEGLLPVGYARVDQDTIATIKGCAAVGFPKFSKGRDGYRRSVQVDGFIPTAEGLTARPGTGITTGSLSLKASGPAIRDRPTLPGGDVEGTPWAGMSGAVAFDKNDRILGVVRHHNPANGPGTLALTPIGAIDLLPRPDRDRFWAALGVTDPDLLPLLPAQGSLQTEDFRALLLVEDYAVFAGRGDALQAIEEFLDGPGGGILAVTAPAGLGKTALLANLVRHDPGRFAYHFFTNRYFASWLDEAFFLRNMLEQLEPVGAGAELQTLDLHSLQTRFQRRLGELSGTSAQVGRVLLLDGLDEVTGWSLAPYLSTLPPETRVIVSIRDTEQDWRDLYRIPSERLTVLRLDGFDREAVVAVFAATGEHAENLIRQPGAADTIMEKAAYTSPGTYAGNSPVIHGADPLHIRFLAEDANNPAARLEDLENQPRGFTAYLERWWRELVALAGNEPVQDFLSILTAALGPLTRADLEFLVPKLFAGWAGVAFDQQVLPKIRRTITGTDETGYAFSHPRLKTYLATPKHVPQSALASARERLLEYCQRWAERDSLYALTHYPSHQAERDPAGLSTIYQDAAYLEASIAALGVDRVSSTLQTVLGTGLSPELETRLRPYLRLLDREAHHLRHPFPLDSRGYVARQLRLQALSSGDQLLADSARQTLLEMPRGQLIPEWTTCRIDPALLKVLEGHTSTVNAVAIAPDSARAVTASSDHTARVWDLVTGVETHTLIGHTDFVNAVAVAPDGARAVTASSDHSARVWDLVTGVETHTLIGHTDFVNAVAVAPDSARAVTASSDHTARVWDLATGTKTRTLTGHTASVEAVVIVPDSTRAVTASWDGTARVWDMATGKEIHTLAGHTDGVVSVAIAPDGTRAVTASWDGTARVWDLATGKESSALAGHTDGVVSVAIAPDGTHAVTASRDGTAKVWHLATGNEILTLSGHTAQVNAVAITPDGTRVITAGGDNTARVWDMVTGNEIHTLTGHAAYVTAVAVTPDGARAVTSSRTIRVWDLAASHEAHTLIGHAASVNAVSVTSDGTSAVTASSDHTARVWNLATGNETHTLTGHTAQVNAVAITSDSTRAVTASWDNTARVWDLATGTALQTLTGHTDGVVAVSVTSDGTSAVTASSDHTARVWDLVTGRETHILAGHTAQVNAVAITSDSTRAVTASWDNTARVWDLATGTALQTLTGHTDGVVAVSVTPDGTSAVTASSDHTARVWDLVTGRETHILAGHTAQVNAVAITSDSTRAVTVSSDQTARVWDLSNGVQTHTLTGHSYLVNAVAIMPDNTRAVTASWDATARLWDLTNGSYLQSVALGSSATQLRTIESHGKLTVVITEITGCVTVLVADIP